MTSDVATPPDAAPLEPAPRPTTRKSTAIGTYRPGLDGMRGLAMLCMLGYHGEIAWCRGAFLALSQFFTLSGFLITGVLLRNHLRPGGEMTSFWTRRIRRLMPAAILALIGIVIYGATVATRQQADALPGDVFAAATWTANWHFILSGQSYLNLFAAPSPVQHFWSLAIEEQFYLVLPVVLILVIRRTRSLRGAPRRPRHRRAALHRVDDRALPGRREPRPALLRHRHADGRAPGGRGAGRRPVPDRRRVLGAAPADLRGRWACVCFVATLWCWSNISLADGPIWRGGFLAYSFLSCGVILGVLAGKAPLTTILSFRPIVYIGRISYGVYLFHWPVYLWLDQARTGLDGWALLSLRLAVTFALAILSFRLGRATDHAGSLVRARRPGPRPGGSVRAGGHRRAHFVTVNRSGADPLATLPRRR